MHIKQIHFILLFLVFLLCTAGCSSTPGSTGMDDDPTVIPFPTMDVAATPMPLPEAECPFEVLLPATITGELMRISGTGKFTSDPFQLSETTTLRVHWIQSSQVDFSLAVINKDPAFEYSSYGKVNFEMTMGPSASCGDYEFIPGEYQVLVETADGPWQIWVEIVVYDQ